MIFYVITAMLLGSQFVLIWRIRGQMRRLKKLEQMWRHSVLRVKNETDGWLCLDLTFEQIVTMAEYSKAGPTFRVEDGQLIIDDMPVRGKG